MNQEIEPSQDFVAMFWVAGNGYVLASSSGMAVAHCIEDVIAWQLSVELRNQIRESANFARIARRSLIETRNHLQDGKNQEYFTCEDEDRLRRLALRAQKATTRLIRYLDSCKGRAPTGWEIG